MADQRGDGELVHGIARGPGGCQHVTITAEEARTMIEGARAYKAERATRIPDEATALRLAFDCYERLKELGWREAMYAPADGSPLLLIEPGSTGIHRGRRDGDIGFWIHDGDTWPARPTHFKPDDGSEADPGVRGWPAPAGDGGSR